MKKDHKFLLVIFVLVLCISILEVDYNINKAVFNSNVNKLNNTIINTDKQTDKKMIAITFDDGPGKYTAKLLEGLDKLDARVTFFLLGEKIDRYPETTKMLIDSEHLIGNHTYSHLDLTNYSSKRIKEEFKKVSDLIVELGGEETLFCRPPYGAYNEKVIEALNTPIILWSVDTKDWKNKNAKSIARYIKKTAKDGDIVLLHEIYESSVDGVLMAIEEMQKEGYVFVTVEELLLRDGGHIDSKTVYKSKRNGGIQTLLP